jgi:hypothetical protein
MLVTKCDFCKKNIKDNAIIAGVGFYRIELCKKCGKPVFDFLKRNKIVKEENKKIIKIKK